MEKLLYNYDGGEILWKQWELEKFKGLFRVGK